MVKKLVDTLNARHKELEQITEKLTQDKEVKYQEIQTLTKRFEQIEAEMNNKVKRLKSGFVAQIFHNYMILKVLIIF